MPTSIRDSVEPFLVPVHREGRRFIAIAAVLSLVLWVFAGFGLFVIGLLATAFVAAFFRDPARIVPLSKGLVVSPGDGRVVEVEEVEPPDELGLASGRRVRIAIFLSVFDVHIQRAPIAGRIARYIYTPGGFTNAVSPDAGRDNERKAMIIETADDTEIAVVQIAGWVARRIVTFLNEGDVLGIGERYGLIRFGSRVELYLPPGATSRVGVGQYVRGGETVLADLGDDGPAREMITI